MEIIYSISFYIISTLIVLFALITIFCKKIIYSVISAFLSLFMVGLLLISLGFSYLGGVQILLSAAVMSILTIISTALTISNTKSNKRKINLNGFLAICGILILIISMILSFKAGFFDETFDGNFLPVVINNKEFAEYLFINYGTTFVFSALAFLSAILGFGVILADRDIKGEENE